MADLRIVDAPEIPKEDITGQEKLPTGGSGNYSITLDSVADYTKTKKDLADNISVDGKVNGVRQELNAHIEDLLNPHQVTKGQIGLGNVDNTADLDKPVSNSAQAAIISAVAPKSDKTYVDNQLTLKANKACVYTKQESNDLVNNSISTALTPVNTSLDLAKRGIANRYDPLLTYDSGERVVLTNGDIVKSMIDANTNDPNVNITGWVKANSVSQIFDESGKTQQEINDSTPRFFKSLNDLLSFKPKNIGQLVTLFAYHEGGQLGGSDFIAIQSSILIENGVTVFRSTVVGFEDYFWVRVNISRITPEMAGAIGDKAYNCRDAFQKCFNIGGDLHLNENSKYLVYGDDITTHRDTYILKCTKPISITCAGKASVYFKHDVITGSPRSIIFEGVGENLASLKMEGVDWYGHETEGHANKVNRAWGIGLFGVDNYSIKRCTFSTFQGHCPDITRRKYSNNGDWINSSDLNQANTAGAVNNLMALCSKNGRVENIKIRHIGSTGLALFGVDGIVVDGVDANVNGGAYDLSVWTDDASSETALKDYALNRNIAIRNVIGGSIDLAGCASGSVSNCNINKITVRSYDFDQQKNNFDFGSHPYNTNDHLNTPFLWQQWFDRKISIHGNIVNKINIRSIYVDVFSNYINTTADNQSLVVLDRNGILWGNGSTYSDVDSSFEDGVKNNVKDNTFIVKHTGCIGIDYGTASSNSYVNAIDNIIEKVSSALIFTPIRYASQFYRRNSHYETSKNSGYLLSQKVNHHMDVAQGLLTQGVGQNNLKTYGNIYANQTVQPIAAFTNITTSVWFYITLLDSAGGVYRKVIDVTAAGARTVTDKDALTTYNTAFTVTQSDGVTTLNLSSGASSICFDLIAVGTRNNCVFLEPPSRITSSGG